MKTELEKLIQALREELVQYGEALALLEHQKELIANRCATELLQNVEAITVQVDRLTLPRKRREEVRKQLAQSLGQPATTSFLDLVAILPTPYRPLLEAMVSEINDLLKRAQARLIENNLLLRQALFVQKNHLKPGQNFRRIVPGQPNSSCPSVRYMLLPGQFPGSRSSLRNRNRSEN